MTVQLLTLIVFPRISFICFLKYDKIKTKAITVKIEQANQKKEKCLREGNRNQKDTHSCPQESHKSSKLEVI